MSKQLTDITFNHTAKTIRVNNYSTIDIALIDIIYNVTRNVAIYNFASNSIGSITVVGNVITFTRSTAGWASTDKIKIYYNEQDTYVYKRDGCTATPCQVAVGKVRVLGYRVSNLKEKPVEVLLFDCIYMNQRQNTPRDKISIPEFEDTGWIMFDHPLQFNNSFSFRTNAAYNIEYINTPAATDDTFADVEFLLDSPYVQYRGLIFNDDFNRTTLGADYSVTGSATFSMVTSQTAKNYVQTGGSASGAFGAYMIINKTFTDEEFRASIETMIVNMFNNNGLAWGVTRDDASGYVAGAFASSNITNPIYTTGPAAVAPLSGRFNLVEAVDIYRESFERNFEDVYFHLNNITKGGYIQNKYAGGFYNWPGAMRMAMYCLSNTHRIFKASIYSYSIMNATVLFIGHSIVQGVGTNRLYRYATLCQNAFDDRVFQVAGAGGNTSTQILANVNDFIARRPKRVYIDGLINDVFFAISQATSLANMQALINAFVAEGIEVHIAQVSPIAATYTGSDKNPQINTLNAALTTLTGYTYLHTVNAVMKNGGSEIDPTYTGDGVHLTKLGNTVLSNYLLANPNGLFDK